MWLSGLLAGRAKFIFTLSVISGLHAWYDDNFNSGALSGSLFVLGIIALLGSNSHDNKNYPPETQR